MDEWNKLEGSGKTLEDCQQYIQSIRGSLDCFFDMASGYLNLPGMAYIMLRRIDIISDLRDTGVGSKFSDIQVRVLEDNSVQVINGYRRLIARLDVIGVADVMDIESNNIVRIQKTKDGYVLMRNP
jgi:hypothetical protein